MDVKPGFSLESNKETVILAAMAIGVLGFIYWKASKIVETAKDAVVNTAKTTDKIATASANLNPIGAASNFALDTLKNSADSIRTGGVTGAIGDFLDRVTGTKYEPNK